MFGLFLGRQVLVDNAKTAFLCERNCELRLGHGVHRGGEYRDVELDIAGDSGGQIYILGQHCRMGGQQ